MKNQILWILVFAATGAQAQVFHADIYRGHVRVGFDKYVRNVKFIDQSGQVLEGQIRAISTAEDGSAMENPYLLTAPSYGSYGRKVGIAPEAAPAVCKSLGFKSGKSGSWDTYSGSETVKGANSEGLLEIQNGGDFLASRIDCSYSPQPAY